MRGRYSGEFSGKKRFLSNMYPATIKFGGYKFHSSGHLYQSFKSEDIRWKELVASTANPHAIRRLSRKFVGSKYEFRPGWDEIRVDVMRLAVKLKVRPESGVKGNAPCSGRHDRKEK